MSKKRRIFTAELKTKLVLEVIKNESTLNEIASKNNVTPKNLQNWKKIFLENAEVAMEPAKVVKEYKKEITNLQAQIDRYTKTVGKITMEKEWLEGKLESLDLLSKKKLINSNFNSSSSNQSSNQSLSISSRCKLLKLNRSSLYYKPSINENKISIKDKINNVYKEIPIYGERKVHQQLLEDGYNVSLNTVSKYRKEMNLKAILAVKPINTTTPNKKHKKWSYKLRGLDIIRANQVWSTDITYIKIKGGMVYMAAIIDWYSKAILSYKISNTMDSDLVMSVLNEALLKYGKPEIFNTDQGSQYTSYIHTNTLIDNNITISMDGKGRATDNICIERFWRSAKCEKIYLNEYNTIKELKQDVRDYIYFYNYKRFHQSIDYKKPMSFYNDDFRINDKNYGNLGNKVA